MQSLFFRTAHGSDWRFFFKKKEKRDRDSIRLCMRRIYCKFPLLHARNSMGRQELEDGRWQKEGGRWKVEGRKEKKVKEDLSWGEDKKRGGWSIHY